MPLSTASLAADLFPTGGLLDTLLDISLTGISLLSPRYGPSGELEDFALEYLNPAGQRMTGMPERPGGTLTGRYSGSVASGTFDYCRRVYEAGATDLYKVNYQAGRIDNYFHVAARRSGGLLVVSFTDTGDQDRSPVEVALRESQARAKQACAEAEAERQRLHDILMLLPAQVAVNRGPDHVFELVNPRYQQMFPSRLVQGKPVRQALPELEGQQFFEMLDRVYQSGEPFYGREMPARVGFTNSGRMELRYVDVFFQVLRNAQGLIEGILNFSCDVTEGVVARKAIEESEARFRSLAENAPDVITRHGKDYRYLYASPRIEGITGIKAEAFIGKSYREAGLPEALCTLLDEHLAYVFAHQTLHTLEYAMPGGKGYILSRMVPEYNEVGEVDSVLVFSTDISDRKRVEAAVRKSEEKYRTLFDAMDEGFFLCEVVFDQADAPVDVYYREANPAAARMVGEGFTGRRAKEIRSGDEADWYGIFGRVARSGQAERGEQYAASAQKWYTLYVFKVGDEHARRVAVLFRDITERKRREANQAFLADVADAMSRLSTVEEIMATVGAKIGAYLRVKSCSLVDVDDARGEITVFDAWNAANVPGLRSHTLRLADFMNEELSRAGRAGEVVIVGDTRTDPRIEGRDHTTLGIAAYVNVPFHRQGAWTNNLAITDSQPR